MEILAELNLTISPTCSQGRSWSSCSCTWAVGNGEYLMPCLLRMEDIPCPLFEPESQVVPSLLFYFGEDGPKLGVYCFLLSSLITDAKWELLMEGGKPVQLSRNRVRFTVPGTTGCVTITDSFSTSFHVDVTFPRNTTMTQCLQICERKCPIIRETILASIRKASRRLNYTNSIPEAAFLCTEHQATSLHPATIGECDLLTCTTHPASVCCTMTEQHKLWLGKTGKSSSVRWYPAFINTLSVISSFMFWRIGRKSNKFLDR